MFLNTFVHFVAFASALFSHLGGALDNGLALTPPMGWMSWQRFKCSVDCRQHPNGCISEALVKRTVEAMVAGGFVEAGYDTVSIDDCWMDRKRDERGNLQPDPIRFPSGIRHLSDFVHARNMKLGIYGAVGPTTCMRQPGNEGHIPQDAKQYAEWGVDMLKFDGCFVPLNRLEPAYVSMSEHLNLTSRPMTYLCSWPYYLLLSRQQPPWRNIRQHCNMWRVADDVSESLTSILNIIHTYEKYQSVIAPLAGPGSWNDADQLLIGNDGLSEDDCRIQMAMWAILASPLFMSVDLDEIDPWAKAILLNRRVIAINQDALGRQGIRLAESPPGLGIWVKELTGNRLAIAFLRVQQPHIHEEAEVDVKIYFSDLKSHFPAIPWSRKFRLREVFDDELLGIFSFRDTFGLERGNADAATVLLATLTLIDPAADKQEEEEEEEKDLLGWRAEADFYAHSRRGKEGRMKENFYPGLMEEKQNFYPGLILFCVFFLFLVIFGSKLRSCLRRRLSAFRTFAR